MPKQNVLTRYNLIIGRLQKGPADFAQLASYLERQSEIRGYDYVISKRTFQREIKEIEKLGYAIKFDKRRNVYFIQEAENNHEQSHRLLQAAETLDLVQSAKLYTNHIQFETRKPAGLQHFHGLLHAINNGTVIHLEYQKFYNDHASFRELQPLFLKESGGRWYLVAKDVYDENIKTYALDRIVNFDITKETFNKGETTAAGFEACFGIIKPTDKEPQKIRLSFDPFQGKYIKTYPLHHAQVVLQDNEDALVIELMLYITHDFIMELLSFGDTVQVLSSESLRNELIGIFKNAIESYP